MAKRLQNLPWNKRGGNEMSKRSFLSQLLLRLLAVTGLFLIMNGTVCMLSQTFDASIHRERAVLFLESQPC